MGLLKWKCFPKFRTKIRYCVAIKIECINFGGIEWQDEMFTLLSVDLCLCEIISLLVSYIFIPSSSLLICLADGWTLASIAWDVSPFKSCLTFQTVLSAGQLQFCWTFQRILPALSCTQLFLKTCSISVWICCHIQVTCLHVFAIIPSLQDSLQQRLFAKPAAWGSPASGQFVFDLGATLKCLE